MPMAVNRMFVAYSVAVLGLALIVGAPNPVMGQTVAEIVDGLYPLNRLSPDNAEERRTCFDVLTTLPSGEPNLIAAGYSDSIDGLISVLGRDSNGAYQRLYDTPSSLGTLAANCVVSAVDIDGDGQKDVVATLGAQMRGSRTWVFRWSGSDLINLTPTEVLGGQTISALANVGMIDVYHDGTKQIVSEFQGGGGGPDAPVAVPYEFYRILPSGAEFQREKYVLTYSHLTIGEDLPGDPSPFWLSEDSTAPYVVTIVNGDRVGGNRVTGGSIVINGTEIIGPTQLNASVEFVQVTLPSLPTRNQMAATLTGGPGAFIHVLIEDSTIR